MSAACGGELFVVRSVIGMKEIEAERTLDSFYNP
jgi:hypothetical protein